MLSIRIAVSLTERKHAHIISNHIISYPIISYPKVCVRDKPVWPCGCERPLKDVRWNHLGTINHSTPSSRGILSSSGSTLFWLETSRPDFGSQHQGNISYMYKPCTGREWAVKLPWPGGAGPGPFGGGRRPPRGRAPPPPWPHLGPPAPPANPPAHTCARPPPLSTPPSALAVVPASVARGHGEHKGGPERTLKP